MIVTKHLLEQFLSLGEICEKTMITELSKIGLEVENFKKLRVPDGVVVGYVIEKVAHPDADKLSVCQVDIGEKVLQIVCGASNVQSDQFVAVAVQGAVLQTPKGELNIAPTTLRGVQSYGMLCSSAELGFPKINEGIMVLDESIGHLELGRALNTYKIFDNFVLEIGLTPNRGDCLSVLGIARDLSVAMGLTLSIKNYKDENVPLGIGRVLQVINEGRLNSSLLYKVAHIASITSNLMIKLSLELCGIASSTALQDFLNFSMHNTGVILRAYSFSYFKKSNLSNNVEGQILLKQDENHLDSVYGKEKVSIVGISLTNHEISQEMVVLEASYISPKVICEALYEHPTLPKDTFITYKTTRGSNPDLNLGMQYLCHHLIDFSHSEVYASKHRITQSDDQITIRTTFDQIIEILGVDISKEEIAIILKKLGFRIEASFDECFFMATPPEYRHDIQSAQDIAEEVLRVYGIDKLPAKPLYMTEQSRKDNHHYFAFKAKMDLMKKAMAQGFYETLHYVFYERRKLIEMGIGVIHEELDILNPITQELNTLRTSLFPAMLDSIKRNENFGFKEIAFCEYGICYGSEREEIEKIAFCVNANRKEERFPFAKGEKWDFYSFAQAVCSILGEFELVEFKGEMWGVSEKILHPYQKAQVLRKGKSVGFLAKINPEYGERFVCEVQLDPFIKLDHLLHQSSSKYQASLRDLTVMIQSSVKFSEIKEKILSCEIPYLCSLYPLDLYHHESFQSQVALSIRFVWQSFEKTLQEEEINTQMHRVLQILENDFEAKLRQ
ncbi:phenylalanine--tRNA ligase subunit beta [Helicobacter cholecystus]|uniref:Phenylalanine--tRNA ligase beta subunit n=1 Tax=Helicobacter cholecystus TaxID=45498 RepID=A0A3D8IT17_9HELI|nr:phenylalanine--tRNA ligase subunit beta [Helicobacter cholecystus]RDU68173.1 phenylalanine--tRNA ligase subunit beta [Helicobacter cholecystus]VEJ26033.1 phenylalanyl-tRNA synthetase subunit beta [Helicobacter cholecystus]